MSKKNSFVKQASFLMIAGLLVRVIGLLYFAADFRLQYTGGGVKTYVGAAGKETVSECTEGF